MWSLIRVHPNTSSMREQRVLHIEDTSQIERSRWVLDSPNPPPLWKKLLCFIKETLLPHGNKLWFCSKKKSFQSHALCFLQSLFPILVWLKDYTASKFKDDLLAGLTLASLCIPQVGSHKHHFYYSWMAHYRTWPKYFHS